LWLGGWGAAPASAFDYLEHSFLTDRACLEAQLELGAELAEAPDDGVGARYLALALACPESWERPYCADDYKQLEGNLNQLDEAPSEGGEHPVTLGDFAALPDHLSLWGAVAGIRRAEEEGVTTEMLRWLAPGTGDPGGVVSDVGEDGCETDDRVDWPALEVDVAEGLRQWREGLTLPAAALSPWLRGPLARGPEDWPAGYSFDNPHYLDLVLMNHHHFNVSAHDGWLGFHSAAAALLQRRCAEVLALDADDLSDLAEGVAAYADVEWDGLDAVALGVTGCGVVAARVGEHLARWSTRADARLRGPAGPYLARMADPAFADRVVVALIALVFEGGGLHFLQDSLSGGHVRVDRAAYDMERARHMHNADGAHGVSTTVGTRTGERRLVVFGDGWVLGRSRARAGEACAWDEGIEGWSRDELTACLLRAQRGALVATSVASLVDWGLGGVLFAEPGADLVPACTRDARTAFVCETLPTRPSTAVGMSGGGAGGLTLAYGDLPEVPPPFSYESVSVITRLDAGGDALQAGVRVVFLSELDDLANWMTSWDVGLLRTMRFDAPPEVVLEAAYSFHWRWAARFLVNAGTFGYGGLRGFGPDVEAFAGLEPMVGFSLLPEGWIKMPVEFTASYRLPITLLDSGVGWSADAIRIEAHWLELAVGLAFL